MTDKAKAKDKVEEPKELPTPEEIAEQEEADRVAAEEHEKLLRLDVGVLRPADSVEARLARVEKIVKQHLGVTVLTPETAKAAAKAQDDAEKEREKQEREEQAK